MNIKLLKTCLWVIGIITFAVSCERISNMNIIEDDGTINLTKKEKYPIISRIKLTHSRFDAEKGKFVDIELYLIDSCEYVGRVKNSESDFLTHKGNCKYCLTKK